MKRTGRARDRAKVLAGRAGVRRRSARPQGHQEFAVGSELLHGMVEIIRDVNRIIRPDRDPVRAHKEPFTPRALKLAVAVENQNREFAPIENENAVTRIRRHSGDFDKTSAFLELAPTRLNSVIQGSVPQRFAGLRSLEASEAREKIEHSGSINRRKGLRRKRQVEQ